MQIIVATTGNMKSLGGNRGEDPNYKKQLCERKTKGQRLGNSPFVLDIESKTDLCSVIRV